MMDRLAAMEPPSAPKALRVGLVRDGRVVEERVFRNRVSVKVDTQVGVPPSPWPTPFPRKFQLFEKVGDTYHLNVLDGMEGRVALASGITSLSSLRHGAPRRGPFHAIALEDGARGKMTFGDTTILFQLVRLPPAPAPSADEAPAVLGPSSSVDWPLTIIAAFSFLLHFGFAAFLYSDWMDPVVPTGSVVGLVDLRHTLSVPLPIETQKPPPTEAEPPPPPEKRPTPPPTTGSTAAPPAPKAPAPSAPPRPAATPKAPASPPNPHVAKGPPAPHPHPPAKTAVATSASSKTGSTEPVSAARAQGLAKALERMQAGLLGTRGSSKTASSEVLAHGTAPLADLSEAARRATGIDLHGSDLRLAGDGPMATPSGRDGLEHLWASSGERALSTAGQLVAVNGPKGDAVFGRPEMVGATMTGAEQVIAALRPKFKLCYLKALAQQPTLAGKVVVTATIAPSGEVTHTEVLSNQGLNASVADCIQGHLRRADFPRPSGGGVGKVTVPVSFVQQR